jgi:hypothetical protein
MIAISRLFVSHPPPPPPFNAVFKSFLKKAVKACLPYGFIVLYRKFKSRNGRFNNGTEIKIENIKPIAPHPPKRPEFIVTLTSYGQRVKETVPYAVYSLFDQTIQPDKIVLWLAHETKIPDELTKMQKFGLEIRFCDDIKSYTKLIPALLEFPDDILVTADDDNYYPGNWFELLKESYFQDVKKIHCHRAHEICLDENKNIIPYNEWRGCIKTIEHPKRIFPTGVGGILYPPHSLPEDVLNVDKIMKLAPTGDDIWFWAMAKQNGTEYAIVKNCIRKTYDIGANEEGLWKINVINKKNDEQIQNIIKEYPNVYKSIL